MNFIMIRAATAAKVVVPTLFECDWCERAYHKECTKLLDGDERPDDYKCYQCEAETQEVQHSAPSIARARSCCGCFVSFLSDAFDRI